MSTSLTDQVCIVTGASSGIGEATARRLARHGARVVLAARRADRLEELSAGIAADGGTALAVPTDIADRDAVGALIERTREAFGRIDVLINNAGIMPLSPLAQRRMDDWDRMIDVNLKGVLYAIGHVLPTMLEQGTGHVVNVSSVAGRRVMSDAVVYCATKHGVHAISEGLRAELAELSQRRTDPQPNSIRVTTVAPGVVRTELPDSILDESTQARWGTYLREFEAPLSADEIADAMVYALTCPEHVNINEILVRPVRQVR